MPTFESKNIRNLILLGHSGCGKTSLVEALLFSVGAVQRMGSVNEGNTVSDYNEDEKERKCSLASTLISLVSGPVKVNMIDTPGYTDFIGELVGGLRAVDTGLVVVNATGGVEIGAERGVKMAQQKGAAVVIFINKLDKEHADFERCIEGLQKKFGKKCVPMAWPVGKESGFKGIANLLTRQGLEGLAGEDAAKAKAAADAFTETIAESDDALLEKYLEKGELSADELKGALRKAVVEGKVMPVLCGAVTKEIGVKELLGVLTDYAPSPADMPKVEATDQNKSEKVSLGADPAGPLAAHVFKTLSDPYLGQITIFKIFSGKMQANSGFYNVDKGAKEKIGQVFSLMGKAQVQMESIQAGDIGCVAKLKNTGTNDSMSDEKTPLKFDPIQFPDPAISYSLKPKTRDDEEKISTALHKLTAEDPTFKISRDEQTKEMIVNGMGDIHITTMINRMKLRFGVQVDLGTPKVPYKETIMGKGNATYRHKKQTGGSGQFAEVWLRVEPVQRGVGFEFVNEVKGGNIPGPFIVSCEKGIRATLGTGILAGFPVVDVRAIVYDGKTHPVDSKDIAFQVAARRAFKESMEKAKPVLLEPIMDVEFVVPEEFMGDIAGSLNQHRGRVMGMEAAEGAQTITAKVPLDEMYKYVNEMKSITGGRGTYTMTFSHYEVVPSSLVPGIVEKAKAGKVEQKDED
ncbi:MAG TPA: elongation factor G [Elusimicrobia bacterium]|nr:elongation factor G [Elusimicrobiota bacterium]